MRKLALALGALFLIAVAAVPTGATTITVVNADGPGEGFNDSTPVSPVGGNPGTTLGQQRLLAFQHAADIWASIVHSDVPIVVKANFDPLQCDATSGTLGSAGPTQIFSDFDGAPLPNTWYPVALANKLAHRDLAPPPGSDDNPPEDITARFSSTVGSSSCLRGKNWYYGFDGAAGGKIDLIVVLLHELGHGLGFINLVDETTGKFFMDIPDVASFFTLDASTGQHWVQMSDAQRLASATNTGNLVFDGASTTFGAGETLDGAGIVTINSPDSIKGTMDAGKAVFGPALTVSGVTGEVILATDAADSAGPSTSDACSTLTNAAQLAGRIALVDRGTCTFLQKVTNVQNAGAIGVVIANDQPGSPFTVGPGDTSITIPVVSITQADGTTIKGQLAGGVNATLRLDSSRLAGANASGFMKLYAPSPVESGSSISHWDTSASPNLLMEPSINTGLPHEVDLTRNFFVDIGWFAGPRVKASNHASLANDHDGDGLVDPGDTIRYTVTLTNEGDETATGLRYDTTVDPNTRLVSGSASSSVGTVSSTATSISANLGSLAAGSHATVTLDVLVPADLSTSVLSVSNQGSASGSNFTSVSSSDPAFGDQPRPTVTEISHSPIRALKTARLFEDTDHNGGLTRGETLEYTITISNLGATEAAGVVLTDTPDTNSVLVNGSVTTTKGSVTEGNGTGQGTVRVNVGSIAAGQSVTIKLRARTRADTPAAVTAISNQGSVSGTNFTAIQTDDPAAKGSADPTLYGFKYGRKRTARR